MINNSKEANLMAKQEGNTSTDVKFKASSSSTKWPRLKNPRIVCVSRDFGGKDRHSKVCTVRGLRDRRVRLSVPTAIQLYDLQDKLGLDQPSKVVDWLLEAAKHEIDELPPLPVPPINFGQNLQNMLSSHGFGPPQSEKGIEINSSIKWNEPARSNVWSSDTTLRGKPEEVEKENWKKRSEERKQVDLESHGAHVSSNKFFPRSDHSSLPGLLNNVMPHNSFLRGDPSSLSEIGNQGSTTQPEDVHNFSVAAFPSTLPISSAAVEFGPKQFDLQMSSSSQNPLSNSLTYPFFYKSQPMRPFHFSMTTNSFPSQNNYGS